MLIFEGVIIVLNWLKEVILSDYVNDYIGGLALCHEQEGLNTKNSSKIH